MNLHVSWHIALHVTPYDVLYGIFTVLGMGVGNCVARVTYDVLFVNTTLMKRNDSYQVEIL